MLQSEAGYIDARPLTANSTKFSCNARPDHTSGQTATSWGVCVTGSSTPRKPTFACAAINVEKGHEQTHALQQNRAVSRFVCQAFSSSSKALASLRSSVSKPSVNQP